MTKGATFSIVEVFDSVQGEGPNLGLPATFIRTAGCNLSCPHCDTKYSWEEVRDISEEDLERLLHGLPVVLTGGEPLLQSSLVYWLILKVDVHVIPGLTVETNGTIAPQVSWLNTPVKWSISPKLHWFNPDYRVNEEALRWFNQSRGDRWWKFVVRDTDDCLEAFTFCYLRSLRGPIVFQPANPWVEAPRTAQSISDYLHLLEELTDWVRKTFPEKDIRVLPQWHALLGMR